MSPRMHEPAACHVLPCSNLLEHAPHGMQTTLQNAPRLTSKPRHRKLATNGIEGSIMLQFQPQWDVVV